MIIRNYASDDCAEIIKLFYDTVNAVNSADYSSEQIRVWTDSAENYDKWKNSLAEHYTLVAESDGIITGFGDIDAGGYLDRLFIHHDYQRQGIATVLCDMLEKSVESGIITTHASITARGFFEKRNYTVIREQTAVRKGIALKNYVMEKHIIV
ncbi:MAG: GNAT family N-acetyltransferase [Ruminococcus sp.]|nr:GNAT family N-acetyltransferase [Ruminococcus sp.]